jgi:hypothetical protein
MTQLILFVGGDERGETEEEGLHEERERELVIYVFYVVDQYRHYDAPHALARTISER